VPNKRALDALRLDWAPLASNNRLTPLFVCLDDESKPKSDESSTATSLAPPLTRLRHE